MGLGSTLGKSGIDWLCWLIYLIWLIAVPYWERWNSLGTTGIWRFCLISRYLAKEFQFGTQSDYVSVLALIMEAVQEIGGFSSCRQR